MKTFLAVVFFCSNQQCFFWSSDKLFNTEASCQSEIAVVIKELDKLNADGAGQCIRVPLKEV